MPETQASELPPVIVHQLVPRSALSPARLEKLALKLLENQERRRKRNGSNGK